MFYMIYSESEKPLRLTFTKNNSETMLYDVIIVGGGPAGLTAGIFARRRELKTLIITKELGGQVSSLNIIENYPGFKKIKGPQLVKKMVEQVQKEGVEIVLAEVTKIEAKKDKFVVHSDRGKYEGKTIILAFGKTPRSLNVPGEKKFTGRGVSYCATCDAPLFKNKVVAVVGGGNAAMDAALLLSKKAKKVYLIHRREEFRAFESMVEKVKKRKNVEFILNHVVVEFKGDEVLRSIIIENVKTKERRELKVDGTFIEIGSEVKTDFVKDLVKLDEHNHIIVNNNCETSHPGIFAAGDVTNIPFKQIVVAAGEGAKAALNAWNYLHEVQAKIIVDWAKEVKKK